MLTTKEIYDLLNTPLPTGFATAPVNKISTDSRDLEAGSVFIALTGDNFDGHAFIAKAFAAGAALVIAEHRPDNILPTQQLITVADSLRAYQDIAAHYRNKFDIPVIAITGSNGKTSTKDILAAALSASMPVLKNHANFNNDIGVPKTLLQLNTEHRAAIVEMGMRGPGQIARLTEIAKPQLAIITSITPTHIELLGSLENIAQAKAEIFKDFGPEDIVVLNCDNQFTRQMQPRCRCIYFGLDAAADIAAKDIAYHEEYTVFTCVDKLRKASYQVQIPLLGEHNITNTLAALAVSSIFKLDLEQTLAGLQTVQISRMRQSIEKYGEITVINDAYNASPVSMHMGLKTLQSVAHNRRSIAVLGDMLELGEFAQQLHTELAEHCQACQIDLTLTYGPLTCYTHEKLSALGLNSEHFTEKSALANYLQQIVQAGDVLLFKGSRGMKMEELIPMSFNS